MLVLSLEPECEVVVHQLSTSCLISTVWTYNPLLFHLLLVLRVPAYRQQCPGVKQRIHLLQYLQCVYEVSISVKRERERERNVYHRLNPRY